jgi:dienelactone hydrolase
MRAIEIIIILLLAAGLAASRVRWPWVSWLPLAALAATALHLIMEKYRWQMTPLYVWVGVASLMAARDLLSQGGAQASGRSWAAILGLLLLLALAAAPAALLPVPRVIPRRGTYQVGTVTLYWVDHSRTDPYAPDPATPRELMAQVWYPAEPPAGAKPAPWTDEIQPVAAAVGQWLRLPAFLFTHLGLAPTAMYEDAPLSAAEASYPVVMFSHGWRGMRIQNTYLAQWLAGRGYIVVALEHSYGAMVTRFPNGRTAALNPAGLPFYEDSQEKYLAAARRLGDQWATDLEFVFQELTALNAADPSGRFTGRLDLARLGVVGHSTGGGAVIEFCARSQHCKAAVTMDAYTAPVSEAAGQSHLQQPFLFLFSKPWLDPQFTPGYETLYANAEGPVYQGVMARARHADFTDVPLFSPVIPAPPIRGTIYGPRMVQLVSDYTLTFFDQVFKGQPETALEGLATVYPEVVFERRP